MWLNFVSVCSTEGVCVHTVSMNSLGGRARYAGVCMLSRGRKRSVIFSVAGEEKSAFQTRDPPDGSSALSTLPGRRVDQATSTSLLVGIFGLDRRRPVSREGVQ